MVQQHSPAPSRAGNNRTHDSSLPPLTAPRRKQRDEPLQPVHQQTEDASDHPDSSRDRHNHAAARHHMLHALAQFVRVPAVPVIKHPIIEEPAHEFSLSTRHE